MRKMRLVPRAVSWRPLLLGVPALGETPLVALPRSHLRHPVFPVLYPRFFRAPALGETPLVAPLRFRLRPPVFPVLYPRFFRAPALGYTLAPPLRFHLRQVFESAESANLI